MVKSATCFEVLSDHGSGRPTNSKPHDTSRQPIGSDLGKQNVGNVCADTWMDMQMVMMWMDMWMDACVGMVVVDM